MQRSRLRKPALPTRSVLTREDLDATYAQVVSLRRQIVEAQSVVQHAELNHSIAEGCEAGARPGSQGRSPSLPKYA